jgi:hypothetical protein
MRGSLLLEVMASQGEAARGRGCEDARMRATRSDGYLGRKGGIKPLPPTIDCRTYEHRFVFSGDYRSRSRHKPA